jgi:tRNA/tmRNA/rRNA uracil-C5-methylase (TrmA/RlmC/RlmD family)
MVAGDTLTLDIERPAVGGRMIARHEGAVVLVAGAIPGERVRARVERVHRGTVFARTTEVVEASPDRVPADARLSCGGHVLAHVAAARQAALKAEMIADAFRRIGRIGLGEIPVERGPEDAYRTRARVHVRERRWGFFEAGTHELCSIAGSRQLSEASAAILDRLCAAVATATVDGSSEVEWAETVDGSRRVAHVSVTARHRVLPVTECPGVDALWWSDTRRPAGTSVWGDPVIVDRLATTRAGSVGVQHHVRSFFQGNRFLLQALVDDVAERLGAAQPTGRGGKLDAPATLADLYAGCGLFSMRLAADGWTVEAVEGDRWAAADLAANATRQAGVRAHHAPVERAIGDGTLRTAQAVIVDPPRAGLPGDVVDGLCALPARRLVYVSCDPATLARDVRRFVDGGFALGGARAFDLFPRTAHVETIVTLTR